MKTMTVSQAKPQLERLVEKVQNGAPVILVQGNRLAKLERYELPDADLDNELLVTRLLEAVEWPHSEYSIKDLDAAAAPVRQRRIKKR